MKNNKYNWKEIQEFYDQDHTWIDVRNKFGCSNASMAQAVKRKDFITRGCSESLKLKCKKYGARKHTEETKQKISKIRIEYLKNNPDKVPYLINHSSKQSYPERVFENALNASKIEGWVSKYRNGLYEYDFAFPDKRIDVEIDGGTHKSDKVKKIDARRDAFSKENGWIVIRFEAERVKKNVIECINELKKVL